MTHPQLVRKRVFTIMEACSEHPQIAETCYFPLSRPFPPKPFPSNPGRAFPLALRPDFFWSRLSLRMAMLSVRFFCLAAILAFKFFFRSSLMKRKEMGILSQRDNITRVCVPSIFTLLLLLLLPLHSFLQSQHVVAYFTTLNPYLCFLPFLSLFNLFSLFFRQGSKFLRACFQLL